MTILDNPAAEVGEVSDALVAYLLTVRDNDIDDLTQIAPLPESTVALLKYGSTAFIFDEGFGHRLGELQVHPIVDSAVADRRSL